MTAMKIADSNLTFSSQHTAFAQQKIEESYTIRRQANPEDASRNGNAAGRASSGKITLSQAGLSLLHKETADAGAETSPAVTSSGFHPDGRRIGIDDADDTKALSLNQQIDNDPHLNMMRYVIEMLTGRKVNSLDTEFLDPQKATEASANVLYETHRTYSEFEQTDFAAEGVVKTADGREINFSIQLSMSRYFSEESYFAVSGGNPKDPLVLNFSGSAAALSDTRFSFDLDGDGKDDDMRMLAHGSGFLVFDRNGDGKVNNGSELFGTKTGDGFAELAALDGDKNGWIDENDSAWQHLRIWTKDADGQDTLLTLKEANVGAIALKNIETPFSIKDLVNQLQAQIHSTGIFLKENGGVGTVQKIDLVI